MVSWRLKVFPIPEARNRPRDHDFRNLREKTMQDSRILIEIRCVGGHFVATRRSPARPLLTGVVGGEGGGLAADRRDRS